MTLRTQHHFQVARHLPVRWRARSWRPRITRLSPLSCSESTPNCRRSRRTMEVVCVWRRLSKRAPVRTDPWASRFTRRSFLPGFGPTTH